MAAARLPFCTFRSKLLTGPCVFTAFQQVSARFTVRCPSVSGTAIWVTTISQKTGSWLIVGIRGRDIRMNSVKTLCLGWDSHDHLERNQGARAETSRHPVFDIPHHCAFSPAEGLGQGHPRRARADVSPAGHTNGQDPLDDRSLGKGRSGRNGQPQNSALCSRSARL